MSSHPATWSSRALANYQRARSGPVRITHADGTVEIVSAWAMENRKRAARVTRKRKWRKRPKT